MNPLFQQAIIETARRTGNKKVDDKKSNYHRAKDHFKFKITLIHLLRNSALILVGIILAGFGLESFLLPNSFIDGGVTGISLLVGELTGLNLAVLILLINIPFIFLAFTQIGKTLAFRSIFAIVGLAIAITFIHYPIITSDTLLVSVFGGFFLGAGIGFTMRGGGVLDGTEILAIYLAKKSGLTIGDIILALNIVIFSVAAYLLSIETALYSILTYLAASRTVDYVISGVEEYTGVTIISSRSNEIRSMISKGMGRGVTIYKGERGFGKRGERVSDIDIVYTVITRLEIAKLKAEVNRIDTNAFMVMSVVRDTKGGMIKKRPLH